ncbi:hypothetical protein BJ138DRAFT_1240158 [Hygrophoropsis aurantiaca]|uniref:Uncharacterized protein n=1 Tax=Hygrophoropsis aurantiaca TaxID=72124 RepID=A0ACB7ZV38_9AGAM|nr:hypothetical protein BJ138DRAFT_1240158 [Hygrophoropsis aurantiaca]
MDLQALVEIRRKHETRQAKMTEAPPKEVTIRTNLIREFEAVLKEQQDRSIGTGVERATRWTGSSNRPTTTSSGLPSGNAANAASVAKAAAKKALNRRKAIFKEAGMPLLPVIGEGRITMLRPLVLGDYGVFSTDAGLMIGKVITLYTKGAGKNGKHSAVLQVDTITAISYVGVQLFQQLFRQQFRAIPEATALFQCHQFAHLPSMAFLCVLVQSLKITPTGFDLNATDLTLFETLKSASAKLTNVVKISRRRGKANVLEDEVFDT